MSDIFQEVDEEVRRDKAAEFWQKHQTLIFAIAALIVLATAGYRFWDYRRELAEQAAGDQLHQALAAMQADKSKDANDIFTRIETDSPGGYKLLAMMTEAGAKAKTDPAAAAAAFDAIAGDGSRDALFRDAAALRAATIRLDIPAEAERGETALKGIAGREGAYRRTARLTLGAVALARKDWDGASNSLLLVISDPEATPAERRMVQRWLGLIAANKSVAK